MTRDRGSATVLVLALSVVLLLAGGLVTTVGTAALARHRAGAAADLAALATASRALEGADAACAAGRGVAVRQGARLVGCVLDGLVAVVAVQVALPGRLAPLGPATGRARAGPVREP